MPQPTDQELEFLRKYIADNRWQTAKSGPAHEYNIRTWPETNDADFWAFAILVRACGTPGKFYSRTFLYLTLDDHKYWTMGESLPETTVLNRAAPGGYFGKQDAPSWHEHILNTNPMFGALPIATSESEGPRRDSLRYTL